MTGDLIIQAFAKDTASLKIFNDAMVTLNQRFCDAMINEDDFTISLEIHGNKGKLIHCSNKGLEFKRPNDLDRPEEMRNKRKQKKY